MAAVPLAGALAFSTAVNSPLSRTPVHARERMSAPGSRVSQGGGAEPPNEAPPVVADERDDCSGRVERSRGAVGDALEIHRERAIEGGITGRVGGGAECLPELWGG